VERLIDAAELASGHRLELSVEELDLCAVTEAIVSEERGKAARLGCALTLETRAPVVGRYDRTRLSQLLCHLLDNAFKFGAGKPVEVTVEREADSGVIRIVDHGTGIAAEDEERVFGRFERAAPVRNYGGFGLGLWMAREIVSAHSGSIALTRTEGGGTTAVVTLPQVVRVTAA
jgi:signal transduction histidine kinase